MLRAGLKALVSIVDLFIDMYTILDYYCTDKTGYGFALPLACTISAGLQSISVFLAKNLISI